MRETGINAAGEQRERCPLCQHIGTPFEDGAFLQCPECLGLFRPPDAWPSAHEEKARYEEHNNDVHDKRYQTFVSPIVDAVRHHHGPQDAGLDFGSGTAPVIAHVLGQEGYNVACYDPFFAPYPALLDKTYDYIVCCEVIEHFHDPAAEFARLRRLLRSGGRLYCMTMLHDDGIDFQNWHYRRDPTHVFIYRRETLRWIGARYGFSKVRIEGRLITMQR